MGTVESKYIAAVRIVALAAGKLDLDRSFMNHKWNQTSASRCARTLECPFRARRVVPLRCIARRSVQPSATGGSARARRLRRIRRPRQQREPRRTRAMKRRHEEGSGSGAQEKKSALSLQARLAKERERRETQARAQRENMDWETRLAAEREVLQLYASQASRHWQ